MVRRLMILLVFMILNMSLIGGITVAWFTDEVSSTNPEPIYFSAGSVLLDVETDAGDFGDIHPGDEKEVSVFITNKGSMDVELKLDEVEAQWEGEEEIELQQTGDTSESDVVSVEFSDEWGLGDSAELQDLSSNDSSAYYLEGPIEKGETVELGMTVEFCKDMSIDYQGRSFTVRGKIQAVQAGVDVMQMMGWEE